MILWYYGTTYREIQARINASFVLRDAGAGKILIQKRKKPAGEQALSRLKQG